ncbi:MAG: hypothetical protein R2769_01990 [Saprospiraceae bacterium]
MPQTFTLNDLIRFLYKETGPAESRAIRRAMTEDDELYREYQQLLKGFEILPKVKFRPSPATIQNILNYSASTAIEQQV